MSIMATKQLTRVSVDVWGGNGQSVDLRAVVIVAGVGTFRIRVHTDRSYPEQGHGEIELWAAGNGKWQNVHSIPGRLLTKQDHGVPAASWFDKDAAELLRVAFAVTGATTKPAVDWMR